VSDVAKFLLYSVLVGAGATALTDIWSVVRMRWLGVPPPNWAFVGRWLAHVARGHFRHDPIGKSPPVRGERSIGWVAHYLIGAAYAGLLLAIWGIDWICRPTLGPALIVGLGTVVAPFFLMQPGMGAGIAGSRTPQPNVTRVHSVITHLTFGIGLYLSGLLLSYSC
jgi:Protein of unknown function (DUF2938)